MSKAAERAYEQIRKNIFSGKYQAGLHLTEEMLVGDIDVSRTPVREALRQLNSEHLVQFVPNHGTFVATWSQDDVDDIFHLRTMLEGYSTFRAAGRISDDAIRELEQYADEIESLSAKRNPENHAKMIGINHRFHTIIMEAANSDRINRMLSWLVEIPMILKTLEMYDDNDLVRSNYQHRELIDALRAKDGPWAQSVMESHLRAAHNVFIKRNNTISD